MAHRQPSRFRILASTGTDFDGSDTVNSLTGRPVTLSDHLDGVGLLARQFAARCGLPAEVVADFELAGQLHDLGKLDLRFQIRLHNNDVLAAASAEVPLAKSATIWRKREMPEQLAPQDQYPPGARHELLSVAIADAYPELMSEAHDPDLVIHLVASHHGHCRPFAPPQIDPIPAAVKATVDGTEVELTTAIPCSHTDARIADRFWLLVRRHGWYGLAWYEAIFRLADHRRSELEQRGVSR